MQLATNPEKRFVGFCPYEPKLHPTATKVTPVVVGLSDAEKRYHPCQGCAVIRLCAPKTSDPGYGVRDGYGLSFVTDIEGRVVISVARSF